MKLLSKTTQFLFATSCIFELPSAISALGVSAASSAASNLKDFSGLASGLFNNMRTPAALIGGAIVPLGILSAPPLVEGESKRNRLLKKANMLLAIASLLSEILAITYSTVAINKLAEVNFPLTAGVSDLISNHFELAWIGTNVHFLLGMFGFGLLVGTKAYFTYGPQVGKIAGSWSLAAFCQCSSVVNKGIAMGHGDALNSEFHYAKNLFSLCISYLRLILSNAKNNGPFAILAIGFTLYSLKLTFQLFQDPFQGAKGKVE